MQSSPTLLQLSLASFTQALQKDTPHNLNDVLVLATVTENEDMDVSFPESRVAISKGIVFEAARESVNDMRNSMANTAEQEKSKRKSAPRWA